jgi:methionyl-tRNA formyltransferase
MIKIVFFGTGPVAAKSLEALIGHFEIEFVITKPRRNKRDKAPVEDLATNEKITLKFVSNKSELDELVKNTEIYSKIGILVDFGIIVSQKVIDAFELGIVNSHFSKLPQWRGADPITFSILSGQKSTAVSLMLVEPTLDTGKIIAQKSIPIADEETTPSLTEKLVALSNELLLECVPKYISGEIKPRQQPHVECDVSYSRKLTKSDGNLDPSQMTATECERKVRAYLGFPKTRLQFLGREVIITKAKALDNFDGDNWSDLVKCADNSALQIIEIISPTSGKRMKTTDYLRGLK